MRVIPIADPASAGAGCDEESGEVRKVNLPLARRDFLKGSGLLFGTLATGPCWPAWPRPLRGRWNSRSSVRPKARS